MSTELVRSTGAELADKQTYAVAMSKSNLLPKSYQGNPANLLFALEYASALNVEPIHAITSIHVINGKPSASADLMAATVRRAGHKLRVTGDDTYAEATLIRADDPGFEFRARWDIAKARQANLNTPTWKNYPGAMLRSRAITEVIRAGAPDAMFGLTYTPEELGAAVDQSGKPVHYGEPEQERPKSRVAEALANIGAQPEPEPELQDLGETPAAPSTDWHQEISEADGDVDALRALYTRAANHGATPAILEAIKAAATPTPADAVH